MQTARRGAATANALGQECPDRHRRGARRCRRDHAGDRLDVGLHDLGARFAAWRASMKRGDRGRRRTSLCRMSASAARSAKWQAAVQVFKDNLVRTRKLEEETALARASAEKQRKHAMREMGRRVRGGGGRRDRHGLVLPPPELQATAQQMTSTASETASQSTAVCRRPPRRPPPTSTPSLQRPRNLGSSVQEIGRQVDGSAGLAPAGRCRGRSGRHAGAGVERCRLPDRATSWA